MRMRARRAGVVAGLLAGIFLFGITWDWYMPDWLIGAFGGPRGIERTGGLVVRFRPPAGYDVRRLEQMLPGREVQVSPGGDSLVVEVPGVGRDEGDLVIDVLTRGGVEYREVIDGSSLEKLPHERRGRVDVVAPGVELEYDLWLDPDGETRHTDRHLAAEQRVQLEHMFAELAAAGWRSPPHSVVAYEHVPAFDRDPPRDRWRSFFVGDTALLDGRHVASAQVSTDPNTGRPVVLVDFTPDGARRFGEVTARIVGRKLATLVGGRIQSAPIINGPIRGGRASIAVEGADMDHMWRAASASAAALRIGALPAGGEILDRRWVSPTSSVAAARLALIAIVGLGGGLFGLLVGLVIGWARPVWQPAVAMRAGRWPIGRIAVTLLAPVALFALRQVDCAGIETIDLSTMLSHSHGYQPPFSVAIFGVRPIITAFVVVELAMLVVPRWRRLRFDPAMRVATGRWVAALGIAMTFFQSWIALHYLLEIRPDLLDLSPPGALDVFAAVVSPVAGTMLLVIVAGMIRQHGLGNGYGALVVSEGVISLLSRIALESYDATLFHDPAIASAVSPSCVPELSAYAAIACVTAALLRMRIGGERDAPIRLPSSGLIPLQSSSAVPALWALISLGLAALSVGAGSVTGGSSPGWYQAGAAIALVPVWSYAFSRPAITRALAARAGLAATDSAHWRRATLLSLFGLVAIVAAAQVVGAVATGGAIFAMMFAAVALDAFDDACARRTARVAVWPLHQAQHAEVVRRALSDAGIDAHLQGSHLRSLLGAFGPHVPIDVIVPPEAAEPARKIIARLYGADEIERAFE